MAPNPEELARQNIDKQLEAAGWHVCDIKDLNLSARRGIAVREFPLPGHGFADYLLYVDGKATGVIEAKKEGSTLIGVEIQSEKYITGLPDALPVPMSPEAEQCQIEIEVERSNSVLDKLAVDVENNLKRTQCLRHSLLVRVFSGRLEALVECQESTV